jgi:hypothetical protein
MQAAHLPGAANNKPNHFFPFYTFVYHLNGGMTVGSDS